MRQLAPFEDGIPIVADNSDRTQKFAVPATNQRVHNLASKAIERYDGAAWQREFNEVGVGVVPTINVKDPTYGAIGDGVADDTTAIQAAANAGRMVFFPDGTYKISSTIVTAFHGQVFFGTTKGFTAGFAAKITSAADIEYLKVQHNYCVAAHLFFSSSIGTLSKRHIQAYTVEHLQVINCRLDGGDGAGVGGGIGFGNGAGGLGGSMGIVDRCIISHGSIDVFTSDVKISFSFVWALSKPYGIKVIAGVGNFQAFGVDVVPPLSTVAGKKAGFYFTGASTFPRLVGCTIDGNVSLNTGIGVLAENGVIGLSIDQLTASECDDHVVVCDSVVAPSILGSTFVNNNRQGNSSVDILLRDNFAQDMDRCTISGNHHIMTAAIPAGSTGPAIKVETTGARRGLRIIDNFIVQPGAGGGYSDQEIDLVDGAFADANAGSLRGNRGTRRTAVVSGTHAVPLDDTFETVTYPQTLYYAPRIDQVQLSFQGSAVTIADHRINDAAGPTTTSMGIGFSASHPAFTLGYYIDLY